MSRTIVKAPMTKLLALSKIAAAAVLLVGLVDCGIGATGCCTQGPSATPGQPLTAGELRLALVDRFGPRWYCDPDLYPIARFDEQQQAIDRFAEMQAEGDTFRAVLARLHLNPGTDLTPEQKLAVYRIWKALVSIPLDPAADGGYRFDYLAMPTAGQQQGTRTTGTIAANGTIAVDQQVPAGAPPCPICLARGTRIDTPDGPVAVEALRPGDPIWTRDAAGLRVAGIVIAVGSTVAPPEHRVVRLTLADGRTVTASPGHPLADGRPVGDLRPGDVVDGSAVVEATSLAYDGGETFDFVGSGPTGGYFAGGIPLGSTLAPSR